jgi:hypothetical protein
VLLGEEVGRTIRLPSQWPPAGIRAFFTGETGFWATFTMNAPAAEAKALCSKCGTAVERSGHLAGQCLVCLVGLALNEESPTPGVERFDHYQVATFTDGTPIELAAVQWGSLLGLPTRSWEMTSL